MRVCLPTPALSRAAPFALEHPHDRYRRSAITISATAIATIKRVATNHASAPALPVSVTLKGE